MVTGQKKKGKANGDKPRATPVEISQLAITGAYVKTFSSGKRGFFGKGMNPHTGQRYQIIGAVELS